MRKLQSTHGGDTICICRTVHNSKFLANFIINLQYTINKIILRTIAGYMMQVTKNKAPNSNVFM